MNDLLDTDTASGFIVMLILSIIVICIPLTISVYLLEQKACHDKWEHSGFRSEYGFFKNCVIQLEDGTWIPAENYREIP